MYMIYRGEFRSGFTFIGPFETYGVALEYGERTKRLYDAGFTISPIETPDKKITEAISSDSIIAYHVKHGTKR